MNKLTFAALPVAAVLALAGCGGGSGSAGSGGSAGPTASATAKAKANLPAPGSEVDKSALADKLIAGVQSFKTATSETTMSTGGKQGMSMTTEIDNSDPSKLKSWTKGTVDGQPMEAIFDGKIVYTKRGDRPWTKFDPDKKDKGGFSILPANQGDLAGIFSKYKKSLQKVVYVGEEKVDGADVSHYTATTEETFGGKAVTSTAELYVDDQFRTLKSVVKAENTETVLKLGKFNEPVTITIPTDAKER